jgi:hypothetical protein
MSAPASAHFFTCTAKILRTMYFLCTSDHNLAHLRDSRFNISCIRCCHSLERNGMLAANLNFANLHGGVANFSSRQRRNVPCRCLTHMDSSSWSPLRDAYWLTILGHDLLFDGCHNRLRPYLLKNKIIVIRKDACVLLENIHAEKCIELTSKRVRESPFLRGRIPDWACMSLTIYYFNMTKN